jgi:hypothetical protein
MPRPDGDLIEIGDDPHIREQEPRFGHDLCRPVPPGDVGQQ